MDRSKQAELLESVTYQEWKNLAECISEQSARICADSGCTDDEHYCESYAYISADGIVHAICYPDFWPGWGSYDYEHHGQIVAIPLPWIGNGQDLKQAI